MVLSVGQGQNLHESLATLQVEVDYMYVTES